MKQLYKTFVLDTRFEIQKSSICIYKTIKHFIGLTWQVDEVKPTLFISKIGLFIVENRVVFGVKTGRKYIPNAQEMGLK
jgi:hypothetical protein